MTEKLKPKIESLKTSTTEIYSWELYAKINKLLDKLDENSSKNDWRETLILWLESIWVDINHSNFQEKIKIIYKNIFEKDFDKNNDIWCFLELKEFILKSLENNFDNEYKNFILENFIKNIVNKLNNSFTEFIYFSEYNYNGIDFIVKTLKEIMDWKLSQKIWFSQIKYNILKENKEYFEKFDTIKTALELYEKSADYPTDNDNTDFDKYLKDIKNKWLDFRKKWNELYIYTDEWIFIQSISISVENYQFIFEDILKKYEKTPIKWLIEFDQETKITPG